MSEVKERIIGAITVMSEDEAILLWNMIAEKYTDGWDNIDTEDPDEWDLEMIGKIRENSVAGGYVSAEDLKKDLDID